MDYSFHPLADKEVDEIVGSYDGIEDTLGDEFFSELQNALTRVLQLLISSSRGNQMREAVGERLLQPMHYQLMNLDLGPEPPFRKFAIGPYQIDLVSNYDELQAELSSLRRETWPLDFIDGPPDEPKIVTKEKAGKNSITATVRCKSEPEAILSNGREKGIWDLCLILSYLSGRNVFLLENERRYQHIVHGFDVVRSWQMPQAAEIAWSNRTNFRSEREMRPLWYFLHLNSSSDAEVKALLGCVALEIIQRVENERSHAALPDGFEKLIEKLKKEIEQSEVEDQDLRNRLKSAVGKWGSESAAQTFRNLLIHYELIESSVEGIPLRRVRCISEMRNRIAHDGDFAIPDWIDDAQRRKDAAIFIAARLIPAMVMEYLNRKFGLMQLNRVQRNSGIIKEYIYKGTHEGMQIDGI